MLQKCNKIVMSFGLMLSAGLYGQSTPPDLVFVGDSLSAGYQNAQLIDSGQLHGYANIIATQKGDSLNLPLVGQPGFPQITVQQGFSVVNGIDTSGFGVYGQLRPTLDLAVPGYQVNDLVNYEPSCSPDTNLLTAPIHIMAAFILNPSCSPTPSTALQQAVALKPSTAVMWIGSNDVLFSILFGADPTPILTFGGLYHQAVTSMAQASGKLVLANIPDVTKTAYLMSVPKLAAFLRLPVAVVEAAYGLAPGDMVSPYAIPIIQTMGTTPSALPPTTGIMYPIEYPVVIRSARIAQIRATVLAYNVVIAAEALIQRATLVDIYSLVNNLSANGIVVNGKLLTTDFGGGLYSEDGIHPTDVGYAIIANQFIKTMNQSFDANIPPVSLTQVAKSDPLFPQNATTEKAAYVNVGTAAALAHLAHH